MPSVTSAVVSEGVKGLIVVLCFANNRKEGMAHANPITTTKILINVCYPKVIGSIIREDK